MPKLIGSGRTDVGLKRDNNEDAWLVDNNLGLFVVADGMGGAASGELASRLVVETIAEYIRRYADKPLTNPQRFDFYDSHLSSRANTAMQAVFLANKLVYDAARQNPQHKGMGATLVLLMADGDDALLINVGDSRVYRMRPGGPLEQLTVDHRLADDPNFRGVINPEGTIISRMGNTLTRAMGVKEILKPDHQRLTVHESDIFLLCSDGLSDMVPEEMIAKVLSMSGDLGKKAGDLIQLALAGGGRDNVTAVLVENPGPTGLKKMLRIITG